MVPFLLLADWQAGRGWARIRGPALGLAYVAVGTFLPYLPLLPASGRSALNWLSFHAERGIEVESVYASLLMVLAPLGLKIVAFSGPGSWDVQSSLDDFLIPATTYIVAGALAVLGIVAWFRRANYGRDEGFRYACLAMVVTVTFSKVISPQYLVWCLPLVLLWGADLFSRREYVALNMATAVIAALSTAVFPYLFFGGGAKPNADLVTTNAYCLVPDLHPLPVTLIVLRNVLLLGIVAVMVRRTITGAGGRSSNPSVAAV
jgi:hypothetical protein